MLQFDNFNSRIFHHCKIVPIVPLPFFPLPHFKRPRPIIPVIIIPPLGGATTPIVLHYKNAEFYGQTNATNIMKKYVSIPKIFAHVWRESGQTLPLALLRGAKRLGHTRVKAGYRNV